MGRRRSEVDPDRHLHLRAGNYHYKRRVPKEAASFDLRAPHVRISLKTSDLAKARAKRDALELADNEFWASVLMGSDGDGARARYAAAVKRVEALGFSYRTSAEFMLQPVEDRLQRLEAAMGGKGARPVQEALTGKLDRPDETITNAAKLFVEEISRDELRSKSPDQKRRWENKRHASVRTFVALAGEKKIGDITRDDALKLYNFWLDRIAPKSGRPTHDATSGNRDLANMRAIIGGYFAHHGEPDRANPFAKLFFAEKGRRSRPPFATEWIKSKILAADALTSLNSEARRIVLTLIETGARLSEICNLRQAAIVLDADVPHVRIEPSDDPDDPREIKTASSVRIVPLVGVALAAMRKQPEGFPRYLDKGPSLSAALNKHFRANDLFPTKLHKVYSLRHSFEDRMKVAGLDDELRRILMGHSIDRPKYGEGGTLEWRRDELLKLVLPFDPAIV